MAIDWQWGSDYLSRGKKKHERPLYDRGLRIWKVNKWDPDSDISIGWKWVNGIPPFVILHKDGSTTIQAPQTTHGAYTYQSLFAYSIRFTIRRYAGVSNVIQRNFKHYIIEADPRITKPKIQGCKTCKQSGLLDLYCYGGHCWSADEFNCSAHPNAPAESFAPHGRWHTVPCPHDLTDSHTVPKGQECHYCNGTGKRDYGSKPERTLWDGSPIRLRDGKIIKSAATLLERMIADYVEPIA